MAKKDRTLKRILSRADRLEPPVATAFVRGATKMQSAVSISALANALAAGDIKRAMALCLHPGAQQAALESAAAKIEDAVLAGGRLGAEQVNEL